MEILTRTLPPDYTLIDTGDWHIGALSCHKAGIKKLIDRVKRDDSAYVILKGDLIDAILPNDKRFTHCSIDPDYRTPQEAEELLVDMLTPIRDKILAVMLGNHEIKLINMRNIAMGISRELKVPYGGYVCGLDVKGYDGRIMHSFFFTHGRRSIRSVAKDPIQRKGNLMASVKRLLEASGFAHCIYASVGHTHQCIIVEPTINDEIILRFSGGEIKQEFRTHTDQTGIEYIPPEARWYVNTPSFLKLYSPSGIGAISYGEIAGYAPTKLGWIEADIVGGEIQWVKEVLV